MDFNKLIKILMLTTSDQDGEALNAIRTANNLLKSEKTRWDELIPKLINQTFETKTEKSSGFYPPFSDDEIEIMLHHCMENVHGKGRSFIESLNQQWTTRGFLSNKQRDALEKFYNNLI